MGVEEIYIVLAHFLHMGIVQKSSLRLILSRNWLVVMSTFGSVISEDRFLHFIDSSCKDTFERSQKLFKISSVVTHIDSKFQTLCLPQQYISSDESYALLKVRLSFKQYCPLKSQFGLKTVKLRDATSGYL
jgi:hypothetical protein